jgi:hypothetical protein
MTRWIKKTIELCLWGAQNNEKVGISTRRPPIGNTIPTGGPAKDETNQPFAAMP